MNFTAGQPVIYNGKSGNGDAVVVRIDSDKAVAIRLRRADGTYGPIMGGIEPSRLTSKARQDRSAP